MLQKKGVNNMLTNKQIKFLKKEAHHLKPIFQVGKAGVNDMLVQSVDEALEKRELIKISVLQNCEEDKEDVADKLANNTGRELVQLIGNTIILYKQSKENKQIELT